MKCLCEQKETYNLKVEADVGADPIWCKHCGCNLDIEDFSISLDLKSKLWKWVERYGEWIDWDNDEIAHNGIKLEEEHNKQGLLLTKQVQKELEGHYEVSFSPSTFARTSVNEK
ncbi:hypothetical protein SYNTR_1419 [Candidatus Syntrophocurvum alkaliphilum]|uniref:Uncharacterized protein n=1 Tax=Candidatus Syntrophocurvum alkaliphilum TaxID=2293317 RepID=A0A6I6DGL3_9FIRM|nr:hypothetical protein [Candidatus Syntrophocurvum alkaliphilum]QGU00013.1 hypothetical protein SYNTR_1419 [Candidatus Syntrophocurvum alkaliphilum]